MMYNFKREPNKYINKQKKKCVISNLSLDEGAAGKRAKQKLKKEFPHNCFIISFLPYIKS